MRLYELLLHLYPRSFRDEYGGQMREVVARGRRDAAIAPLPFWIATAARTIADATRVHWDVLRQDVRYTLRVLRRAPAFAATSIAVVALGIGATTAAFSVADFVLIRPLPFADPDRLVTLWERARSYQRLELSAANYRDWTRENTAFERTGVYHAMTGNLVGAGDPLRVTGAAVSADLFPTLGVRPLLGRLFGAADDRAGAPGTVIVSYRLWQTQFGGDPDVIGRDLRIDTDVYTVIGVMPREFRFPTSEAQLWTPTRFTEENYVDRNDNWLYGVARLRPGVTIAQARAEMALRAARSRQQYPKDNALVDAAVSRFSDDVSEQSRLLVVALFAAAGCVLLIACANLANLLLVRALGRRRELAVRTAIGAGRERMIRQLLTESLLLAAAGGLIGVAIAIGAVPLLNQLVPSTLPTASPPAVDLRVLAFALALTVSTGIAFGLAPVARVSADADLGGLREGAAAAGGARERLRSTLVVVEIAASVALLVSAGLLTRALWTIQQRDPGFRPDGVLAMATTLPSTAYGKVTSREAFYTRAVAETRALPGVVNAAFVTSVPMGSMRGGVWPVIFNGREVTRAENQNALLRYVTPGYFATIGIPLKAGRDIAATDTFDRKPYAAVVSESFLSRFWPNETPASAIGRPFTFVLADRIVVGVVGNVRLRGLEREAEPQVYLSYRQVPDDAIIGYVPRAFVVRTAGEPVAVAPAVRAIIRRIDPALPVSDVRAMVDVIEGDTASRSAQLRVIAAFAAIAVVLAAVGIHGLLSFAVSQRTQEIGVRMALGARRGDIVSIVVGRVAALSVVGVGAGVAAAYAAGQSMRALLAGVPPADVATVTAAVGLAATMTIVGSVAPALRAIRVDPLKAIRTE